MVVFEAADRLAKLATLEEVGLGGKLEELLLRARSGSDADPTFNPAWEYYNHGIRIFRRQCDYRFRQQFIHNFSFAIPDPGVVEFLKPYREIVEIGAGSGYWAWLLRRNGVSVRAHDSRATNWPRDYWAHSWIGVEPGDHTALLRTPKRFALMLCWPLMDDQAGNSLKLYRGDTVIYIGESFGGCTADSDFFEALSKDWSEPEIYAIPRFDAIHDRVYVYHRKGAKNVNQNSKPQRAGYD